MKLDNRIVDLISFIFILYMYGFACTIWYDLHECDTPNTMQFGILRKCHGCDSESTRSDILVIFCPLSCSKLPCVQFAPQLEFIIDNGPLVHFLLPSVSPLAVLPHLSFMVPVPNPELSPQTLTRLQVWSDCSSLERRKASMSSMKSHQIQVESAPRPTLSSFPLMCVLISIFSGQYADRILPYKGRRTHHWLHWCSRGFA